jgi:hypothetical protein
MAASDPADVVEPSTVEPSTVDPSVVVPSVRLSASPPAQYSVNDASDDLSSYARIMHQHTMRQMEAASSSAHRRRAPDAHATLNHDHSVDSVQTQSSGSHQDD